MARLGNASLEFDEYEIEYLMGLVERDQRLGGAFIGTEVMSALAKALRAAEEDRNAQ